MRTGHGNDPRLGSKVFIKSAEVSKISKLPAYVLRFWESEFTFLEAQEKPRQSAIVCAARCGYGAGDQRMLYDEGHTLAGVKRYWARRTGNRQKSGSRKELANA